jgi:hypothetical protein
MLEHPTGECFDMIWFGSITYIFVFTFPPRSSRPGGSDVLPWRGSWCEVALGRWGFVSSEESGVFGLDERHK